MSSTVTVVRLRRDLDGIRYLTSLVPSFPGCRYRSYIYATIGLCRLATPRQRLGYLMLSFVFSFADFPINLYRAGSHFARQVEGYAMRTWRALVGWGDV